MHIPPLCSLQPSQISPVEYRFYCLDMSKTASLPLRKLGEDGPLVTGLGFGAMTIGMYGEPEEERFKILDRAYEMGCRFWDTADIYVSAS